VRTQLCVWQLLCEVAFKLSAAALDDKSYGTWQLVGLLPLPPRAHSAKRGNRWWARPLLAWSQPRCLMLHAAACVVGVVRMGGSLLLLRNLGALGRCDGGWGLAA
jgi:hypothetical protein